MSDDKVSIWLQHDKQNLQDFIDWSSKWPMKGKNNAAKYFKDLWFLSGPLLAFDYLSEREFQELFLQGFHPSDWPKLTPDLILDVVRAMKTMILQRLGNELPALLTLSSTHALSPPAPEMLTSHVDLIASVPAVLANPSPIPSALACTPALSTALMPSLPLPLPPSPPPLLSPT